MTPSAHPLHPFAILVTKHFYTLYKRAIRTDDIELRRMGAWARSAAVVRYDRVMAQEAR